MGQGYRIVAASRGVRAEEKQAITRFSPSHEALCWRPEEEPNPGAWFAVGFYALPTGRLCVAHSYYAGAEHTARGGQRVYTHNVVLDAQHFPACGFNPFHVVRAMRAAETSESPLKPPTTLPELTLCVEQNGIPTEIGNALALTDPRVRRSALHCLFEQRSFILPLESGWTDSTETLLLGLPGPLRAKTSFGAGLRFSTARTHRINVLRDEGDATQSRIQGQAVEYLNAEQAGEPGPSLPWGKFVEALWAKRAIAVLDRRTSRPFADCSPSACERVGAMYNQIDEMPSMRTLELLALVRAQVLRIARDVEEKIRCELLAEGQKELSNRLAKITAAEFDGLWSSLSSSGRDGPAAASFVAPLIVAALRSASRRDPLHAAEAALDVAVGPTKVHDAVLDDVLSQLSARVSYLKADQWGRLAELCSRWESIRPQCPHIKKLIASMASLSPVAHAR